MKTAACHFGNHTRCKGEIQGTWFEKCDCDCHAVMETEHNAKSVMKSEPEETNASESESR